MAPDFFPEPGPDGIEVDQDSVFCMATDIYAFAMVSYEVFCSNSVVFSDSLTLGFEGFNR